MNKNITHTLLLAFAALFSTLLFGQSNDAFSYIERYNQRLDSIKNFAATFTVKSNFESLEMPTGKGKVFFKWPAHYSISTDAFTVLPKKKLVPIARVLKRFEYKSIKMGNEKVSNHICQVIDLFPNDTSSHVEHYTLWIDTISFQVRRVLILEKDKSEFIYHYTYQDDNTMLPLGLTYTFDFTNKNPQPISYNPIWSSTSMQQSKKIEGKIILNFKYSNIRREGDSN